MSIGAERLPAGMPHPRQLADAMPPVCVLPGCTTIVAVWGDTCQDCVTLFGDLLRPTSSTAPLTREMIAERDSYVDRIYAARRQLRPGPNGLR